MMQSDETAARELRIELRHFLSQEGRALAEKDYTSPVIISAFEEGWQSAINYLLALLDDSELAEIARGESNDTP